jgi:dihydroorotate dehydrogenase
MLAEVPDLINSVKENISASGSEPTFFDFIMEASKVGHMSQDSLVYHLSNVCDTFSSYYDIFVKCPNVHMTRSLHQFYSVMKQILSQIFEQEIKQDLDAGDGDED